MLKSRHPDPGAIVQYLEHEGIPIRTEIEFVEGGCLITLDFLAGVVIVDV